VHVKVTISSDTCERVRPKNILKQPKQTWNSRFNGESYHQFKTKTNSYTRGNVDATLSPFAGPSPKIRRPTVALANNGENTNSNQRQSIWNWYDAWCD